MKYLVAGIGGGRRPARSQPRATPCKSLKKLPGFAGNTNVITVTEKAGTKPALSNSGRLRGRKKITHWAVQITACFQILRSNLRRSIARGGDIRLRLCLVRRRKLRAIRGHTPGQSLKPKAAIALLKQCARAWLVFGTDRNDAR